MFSTKKFLTGALTEGISDHSGCLAAIDMIMSAIKNCADKIQMNKQLPDQMKGIEE